jgi:hypothetical protein
MNKEEFKIKVRKGILKYHADPVIQKRLKAMYARKREEKLINNYKLNDK